MPFASDRLYDGYIRRNMGTIVRLIKVREIVSHLPCLTDSDRVSHIFYIYNNNNNNTCTCICVALSYRSYKVLYSNSF